MPDEWQPGDPIYDESDPGQVYHVGPMFSIRHDGSYSMQPARWRPELGWGTGEHE